MLRILTHPAHVTHRITASGIKLMPQKGSNCSQQVRCLPSCSSWQAAPAGAPRIIIITGPTAVGKTKLGLELAKRIGGEIISADSVQVYRGLDVGSDKLPVEQREGIPHHLIDVLPPDAEFSAGDFHAMGRKAAEDIIARGKTPIVVGGTGFYLRWFIYGKAATPPSNPETAAKALKLIEQAWQQAAAAVAAAGQQQLQPLSADPAAAAQQRGEQQPAAAAAGGGGGGGNESQLQLQQQDVQQLPEPTQLEGSHNDASKQQQQQQQHVQQLPEPTHSEAQQQHQQQQQLSAVQPTQIKAAESLLQAPPAAAAAALSEDQRWQAAVDLVAQLGDPATAARIRAERNNWYRLQRVLQILLQNGGKPLSEMDVDTTKPLDYDFRCFFLHRPRLELYDRICYRVEEMVAGGLLREALMLLDLGMTPNSHIATKAIGYRQACEFIQAALREGSASKAQLQQLIVDIATASRNLVKNQVTWFRDDSMFRWLEVGGRSSDEVLAELVAELAKPQHEGGCGDSGRLDKQTQQALKRYTPTLKLLGDDVECEARVIELLDWVNGTVAARL